MYSINLNVTGTILMPKSNYKKKVTTFKGGPSPLQQLFGSGALGGAGLLANLFLASLAPSERLLNTRGSYAKHKAYA